MKIVLLSWGLLTSLSPLSFAMEKSEIGSGNIIVKSLEIEKDTVRDEKPPFFIIEAIQKIEEQAANPTKRVKDVDFYLSNLSPEEKMMLENWHKSQDLSQNSKKFIVALGKMIGMFGGGKKPGLQEVVESLFFNMDYRDRAKAVQWINSPSLVTNEDEKVIVMIGQKKTSLKGDNLTPEKAAQALDIFLESLSLDEQFQALKWLNNPPSLTETDLVVLNLVDGKYQTLEALGTELPCLEGILAYKWFKQKERESIKDQEKLLNRSFNISPDSLVEDMCIIS